MGLAFPVAGRAKMGYGKHQGVVLGTAKEAPAAFELRAPEP